MGGERRPPQGRDRAIGAQLRAIRLKYTDLTADQAAKRMSWTGPTLSRTENGKRHITSEDVAALLMVYKVPRKLREQMIENAKIGCQTGWWSADMPGVLPDAGALASYEVDARAITDWASNLVPGLLQTREYSVAYMLADGVSPDDVERRWQVREMRQSRLSHIDYTAFIYEPVLRKPLGGREAYREQLKHLCNAYDRGIGVRIVRDMSPALLHSWMLLEFPRATPMVHVELLRSSVFLYDQEVGPYLDVHARMASKAMSSLESRNAINGILERL
ncbi:helix-turn-helix domain-containing protein [Actinokineospora guangxiensis]|uniref:Helix-turn-helix domain-containing protein n=1 Tax=Actinokineospora guangxiensis TaxID=1490288 RepID=A0ABW0EQV0_9PSEU